MTRGAEKTHPKKHNKIKSQDGIISTILIYAFIIIMLIVTVYPFLNVLALSFNDSADSMQGINMIWPRAWTLENYKRLMQFEAIPRAALNTVVRTITGTLTGLISAAILAYTLSRKDYVFRRFIGFMFVATIYVSGGIIPWFLLIVNLRLNSSFFVYIIPGLISVWNVIIIRSFIDNLPYELQESAMLDGAGDFTIFIRIIFPLCKPVIATVSLWIAVGHWNDWFTTYIFHPSRPHLSTLQYELMKVLDSTNQNPAGLALRDANAAAQMRMVSPMSVRMAITVVVIIPILMVYPFIQKYFVTGMTLGAVKS
ncbi:MAG: carbohydrate ABC transporter permease [Clostridia bacterium]|nr:carbohydrate ABC transporter permease [Clostridia bacterium]